MMFLPAAHSLFPPVLFFTKGDRMSDLIFCLNVTLPVFFCMLLGYFLHRFGWISDQFACDMNSFVFKIALPVNLFSELCSVDFAEVWDAGYVLFCSAVTLISVGISVLLARLIRDTSVRGEFVQASYRSSASILGMTYIESIYGSATTGALMMLGAVPLYNVMAVLVLSLMNPNGGKLDKVRLKKALIGIVTNPIIWGILLGFAWAVTGLPLPKAAGTTLNYIGRCSSPLGLLAMGASLDFGSLTRKIRPVIGASFLKLAGFAVLFLPAAIALGFRGEKLTAVLIMLGSASTVAGYVMARNMGHEGTVTAGTVALTTLLSSFTLTFWLWLLKSHGLI